ncbi:MAG: glutathione S-transferase family protein [Stenomitos frigidus ULC029]
MTQLTPLVKRPIQLVTIPGSHYCEKARWALSRLPISWVEEPHMPLFHQFATRRLGGQSVPVLVAETDILTNSEEILRWTDKNISEQSKLYPANSDDRQQIEALVALFDSGLGPAVRQWCYFYILDRPRLVKPVWCQGVPWFERLLFPVLYRPIRSKIVQGYKINPKAAEAAYDRICKTFKAVEALLNDGQTYLVGEHFSAADLTFAALASPVIMPEGDGMALPDFDQLPSQMTAKIQAFRETPAGKFVLRLYERHRRTKPG